MNMDDTKDPERARRVGMMPPSDSEWICCQTVMERGLDDAR